MAQPVRGPLRLRFHHLVPTAIAVGAALYLLLTPTWGDSSRRSLSPALLAMAGALFLLHCALSLRLRHTVAFLAGLELGYCALVLLRSAWAPLLGLRAAEYARGLSLLLPATLILIALLGQAPLSAPRSILRVGMIVLSPLLWAPFLRRFPALPGSLAGRAPLAALGSWSPALPVPAVVLLLGLAGVLAAPRRARSLFDFCLAVSLLPVYVLLDRIARGAAAEGSGGLALAWAAAFVILLYGLYRLFWQRAFLDELTGLGNRRSLEERLRFPGRSYALAMIDIDHFKSINDRYGHAEGDNVLRWVAAHIRRSFGEGAYRYGGEEFVVILPELEPGPAQDALERLRRELAGVEFFVRTGAERRSSRRKGNDRRRGYPGRGVTATSGGKTGTRSGPRAAHPRGGTNIRITVSVGLAGATARSRRAQEVLERADRALYQAKSAGRNRVVTSRPAR